MKTNLYDVCVVVTTYNCPKHIEGLLESFMYQSKTDCGIYVADDGSTDETLQVINSYKDKIPGLSVLELPHKERGYARKMGIEAALATKSPYLFILDGDMLLKRDILKSAFDYMESHVRCDGLVIKEIPYTTYTNFYSKVKVFERFVINNSKDSNMNHSIEAARFWRTTSYVSTGGIHPDQIAFEETQPTIRCIDQGGQIVKLPHSGLYHDEKEVTFFQLIQKKAYYFSKLQMTMDTEKHGVQKAFSRWYLFRPVYYTKKNLLLYIKHPLLFIGMVWMYLVLTIVAAYQVVKSYQTQEVIEE